MSSRWGDAKRAVLLAAQQMATLGLVSGSSGNASMRLAPAEGTSDLMAITPSGVRYDALTEDDIAVVDFEVEPVEGDLTPSSEALLHVGIYQARPDVQAVMHTHSVFASVAAVAGLEIPPIVDEMMITLGGPVQVSRYGFPGTEELADNVCAALGERKAALIRNHGAVGVGRDVDEALAACTLVERVAQVFVLASALGGASPLPQDSIDAELAIYRMRQRGRER